MTSVKQLADRLKRNRELGAMDAANRCAYCRAALSKLRAPFVDADGHKFCSLWCRSDFSEARLASPKGKR